MVCLPPLEQPGERALFSRRHFSGDHCPCGNLAAIPAPATSSVNRSSASSPMNGKPARSRPGMPGGACIRRTREAGITLIELLVTFGLMAILVLIGTQGYGAYKRHVEKATCMTNMRAIHQALANHLAERGHWPQPTIPIEEVTEENWYGWWISTLEPYGASAEAWICPTDKVAPDRERIGYRSSYMPTTFDAHRWTPYKWNQPWLLERGDLHGKGAHVAMPRGDIITTREIH